MGRGRAENRRHAQEGRLGGLSLLPRTGHPQAEAIGRVHLERRGVHARAAVDGSRAIRRARLAARRRASARRGQRARDVFRRRAELERETIGETSRQLAHGRHHGPPEELKDGKCFPAPALARGARRVLRHDRRRRNQR